MIDKHTVDGLQQRGNRAERELKCDRAKVLAGKASALFELPPRLCKHSRRRTLKTVDRLFLVTDSENGTPAGRLSVCLLFGPRAGASIKFCDQLLDHPPLQRTGVLGLVDQYMVEPAIELVEHPRGRIRLIEQCR